MIDTTARCIDPDDQIWLEVSSIPPNTKPWNKLVLPNHKFVRRDPIERPNKKYRKEKGVK